MVNKMEDAKSATISISGKLVRRLRHCLEWASIVRKMFVFESKENSKLPKNIERPKPTGKELAERLMRGRWSGIRRYTQ